MKKTNILVGLSSVALLSSVLLSCNNSKSSDTPAYHVICNKQASYTTKQVNNYDDDDNTQSGSFEETDWLPVSGLSTSDILTVTPVTSNIAYGKDLELTIEAKDWVLLANYKNKTYEEENILTPFKNGYAVPFVGYGNGLGDTHAVPLSHEFYTYTQDETNPQKFNLKVKGEAFKKNIVIDFDMSTTSKTAHTFNEVSERVEYTNHHYYAVDLDSLNAPALISSSYNVKSNYTEFYLYVYQNSDNTFVNNANNFVFEISTDETTYEEYYNPANTENNVGNKLFTLNNFKAGTDYEISLVKGTESTTLPTSDYKATLESTGTDIRIEIPWNKLYNVDTYEKLYDSIKVTYKKNPDELVDVNSSTSDTSKCEIKRKGYGFRTGDIFYNYSNGAQQGQDYYNDSIFKPNNMGYTDRNYKCIFLYEQGDSASIVWPNVDVTYESPTEGGQPLVSKITSSTKAKKTAWRDSYYSITDSAKSEELPYKLTDDGKFVLVCVNPSTRAFNSKISDMYGSGTSSTLSSYEKTHNYFAIYDYYGTSSYKFGDSGLYAKSVSIKIHN